MGGGEWEARRRGLDPLELVEIHEDERLDTRGTRPAGSKRPMSNVRQVLSDVMSEQETRGERRSEHLLNVDPTRLAAAARVKQRGAVPHSSDTPADELGKHNPRGPA